MDLPTVALSIRQPWAWLIVNGHKDIENRSWRTNFRGPVLIHAGKKTDDLAEDDVLVGTRPSDGGFLDFGAVEAFVRDYPIIESERGGIVGVAEIVDCVSASASPWFVGDFGFVLRNARPLPFRPLRGALGFFKVPPA